jgi:hypothetical protein
MAGWVKLAVRVLTFALRHHPAFSSNGSCPLGRFQGVSAARTDVNAPHFARLSKTVRTFN